MNQQINKFHFWRQTQSQKKTIFKSINSKKKFIEIAEKKMYVGVGGKKIYRWNMIN